jgi:D-amino-acid oxidase
MDPRLDVLVIGAGVSGLTTAVCLAKADLSVRVLADRDPLRTTSCAAGAIWGPYLAEDERIVPWAEETLPWLAGHAKLDGSGVRLVHGLEAARTVIPPPAWARKLADSREATPAELPEGFGSGWWYTAPVVDMPRYLAYLTGRLAELGCPVEIRPDPVRSLREAVALAPIVVNCTGNGARDLVPDPELEPSRGQLVVVDNPGLDRFFAEHDECPDPIYFLPQGDLVVLGGSALPGRTDLDADLGISETIRRRCATIVPELAGARVREHRVGLRPTRERVRVERVDVDGRHVVHNYGHGGAGVTVSWGCARSVRELINKI